MKKFLFPSYTESTVLLDASSMLDAWTIYPKYNFPRLWEWLAVELKMGRLLSIRPIFAEVENNDENCHEWFKIHGIKFLDDFSFEQRAEKAARIKKEIGYLGDILDPSRQRGIGAKDLELIVAAALSGYILVTEEKVQAPEPALPENYKIPLVCKKIGVNCINFLEIIKKSNAVF